MSIAERNVEVLPAPLPRRSQFRRPGEIAVPFPSEKHTNDQIQHTEQKIDPVSRIKKMGQVRFYLPLLCCMLIAIVVRVWLVIHAQGFIDGDEALVGIQAQHILHGEFPVYFYNQPYMGSLEAYLMAILFALMGSSVWTLRAEPILLSLVVIWLTWKLAGILADMAHLPAQAKRWFMIISALLAAIPPLYDTVVELRTLGGYIETFVLMLLLLTSAAQLTRRQAAGASTHELTWRWAGIGCIIGLGFWVNPLIISAGIVAGIWVLWNYAWTGKRVKRKKIGFIIEQPTQSITSVSLPRLQGKRAVDTRPTAMLPALRARSTLALLLPFPALLTGCLLGLAPALLWGAAHEWQNFTYMFQLSGTTHLRPEVQAQYPTRLSIFFGLTQLYGTCVGPRLVGGGLPGESDLLAFLHTPMLILGTSCMLATTVLVLLSLPWRARARWRGYLPVLVRIRRLAALPVLFAICSAAIFCGTTTAAIGLWSCQYDLAGRYASPLMLVLPFFVASVFVTVILFESSVHEKIAGKFKDSHIGVKRSQAPTLISRFWRRLASAIALFFRTQAILGILVALLLFALYMQVFSYGLTDSASTFQSPYCTSVPANNDAIIAYLEQEHIHYAWANNWIADPILFKTQGNVLAVDPLPLIRQIPLLNRIPADTNAILQANRPSFIAVVKQNDRYPLIEMILDIKNVAYHVARFPSVQGTDVLVVTPLNRTVSPLETGDFYDVFQCSRSTS